MRFYNDASKRGGWRFKEWRWAVEVYKEKRILSPWRPELVFAILRRDESWIEGVSPWPRVFSISTDFRHLGVYVGERHVSLYWLNMDWRFDPSFGWFGFSKVGTTISFGGVRREWWDKSDEIREWGGPIRVHRFETPPSPSCSPSVSPLPSPEP